MELEASPKAYVVGSSTRLGEVLRRQRRDQKITLKQFYDSTGISLRFMSELERGKIAAVDRLLRAIRMLGFDVVLIPRGQSAKLIGANRVEHG